MNPALLTNKVLLIIMDGLGAAPASRGNAVTLARPAALIRFWDSYPHTYLQASGSAVGLPDNIYGNSEVGHLNIGSGKVVLQTLPRINKAIDSGAIFSNSTLEKAAQHAKSNSSDIHLIGCLSDGAVHSHIDHFIAVHRFFTSKNLTGNIYIHAFTDGRDTHPKAARVYLDKIQKHVQDLNKGQIASLIGRAYAMDRNEKWERTQLAYDMLLNKKGATFSSWQDALNNAYMKHQTDEYIEASLVRNGNGEVPQIKDNDAVIFMNFRSDRALQLSEALISPEFGHFTTKRLNNLFFASMVEYRKGFPQNVVMPKEYINMSLGRVLAENGMRQLRIAESEKFPHVTYFFNGGVSLKYPGEDRIEIPSPNVPTYDKKPEMSALQILEVLQKRIALDQYNFILLNLANTDMVGHTGNLEACIKSVQVVDHVVEKLTQQFISRGGTVILTADHGNVEEVLRLDTGEVDTEHSMNPVPFIVVKKGLTYKQSLPYGKLSDIATTVLGLMGLNKPTEMIGRNLMGG